MRHAYHIRNGCETLIAYINLISLPYEQFINPTEYLVAMSERGKVGKGKGKMQNPFISCRILIPLRSLLTEFHLYYRHFFFFFINCDFFPTPSYYDFSSDWWRILLLPYIDLFNDLSSLFFFHCEMKGRISNPNTIVQNYFW